MANLTPWTIASVLGMSLLFGSCGSDDPDVDPKPGGSEAAINIDPVAMTVSHEAQSVSVTVTSTRDWRVSSDQEWCTVFPTGGVRNEATPVRITLKANGGIDSRAALITVKSGDVFKTFELTQTPTDKVVLSTGSLTFGGLKGEQVFTITSNNTWAVTSDAAWCHVSPASGDAGEAEVKVACDENKESATRNATLTVVCGTVTEKVSVSQLTDAINVPEGYRMVWNDEFNDPAVTRPNTADWWYEVWDPGFVNHELQRYIRGERDGVVTAEIADGFLKIHAVKVGDEVWSARVNTSHYWTYGYFEARLKLPKGKGTWPAFWMMPQVGGTWPDCGEIDIMEEVGVNPNYTSSSIHCKAYNHVMGTQKTKEVFTKGAEDEFHIYALEWTEDFIKTYVDGKLLLEFYNDHKGDKATWPFDKNFGLKLNLAWGGDWGGWNGVDERALPATYEIDYVRVFQK